MKGAMDTEPYLAGILAGIMAVAVVTAILTAVRKKQGRPKPEYDERQMAARGVAYRWAFLTLMLSLAVNTGVEAIWGPWAKPGVSAWMLIFLSIGVFIVACVRKDAYFAVAQNPRPICGCSARWCCARSPTSSCSCAAGTWWRTDC